MGLELRCKGWAVGHRSLVVLLVAPVGARISNPWRATFLVSNAKIVAAFLGQNLMAFGVCDARN